MSFFNLTMVGYQNSIKEFKNQPEGTLPPINCPRMYEKEFSKPFDSNLKYHELRTKHIRHPQGNLLLLLVFTNNFNL